MSQSQDSLQVRIIVPKSSSSNKYLGVFPEGFGVCKGQKIIKTDISVKKVTTVPISMQNVEGSHMTSLRKRNLAYYGGMADAAEEYNKPTSRFHVAEKLPTATQVSSSSQGAQNPGSRYYEAPNLPTSGKYILIVKKDNMLMLVQLEGKLIFKKSAEAPKSSQISTELSEANEQAIRDTYDMMLTGKRKERATKVKDKAEKDKQAKDKKKDAKSQNEHKDLWREEDSDESSIDSLLDLWNARSDHSDTEQTDQLTDDGLFGKHDSQKLSQSSKSGKQPDTTNEAKQAQVAAAELINPTIESDYSSVQQSEED